MDQGSILLGIQQTQNKKGSLFQRALLIALSERLSELERYVLIYWLPGGPRIFKWRKIPDIGAQADLGFEKWGSEAMA